EGGYLVLSYKSFLGTHLLKNAQGLGVAAPTQTSEGSSARGRDEADLPPREADLIDIQVDAAIRRKQVLFSIEELEGAHGAAVAIRTAPIIAADGLTLGATWVMTELVDPLFVDQSLQGYQLAAGLALCGIALAFTLTAGLARTVRRQAVE